MQTFLNGFGTALSGKQLWYGAPRGTNLFIVLSTNTLTYGSDAVAVAMGDPNITGPGFVNALGTGQSEWKQWSYAQFASAFALIQSKQVEWQLSSNTADLRKFKESGGKLLAVSHENDQLIY